MWNTEAWSSPSGALEEKKTGDEIAVSGPDRKLRKVTIPVGIEEEQTFEAVVYPSASMEEKIEIPEGKEAWSDHHLHTFIVPPRYRDFIRNVTTDALQADMTLIMVCVCTRPTIQRETIVRVTGDEKVKLSTTHGSRVPLPGCPEWSAQQPFRRRGQSQRARRDDRKLSAQSVVARRSDQEKLADDDCSRQCKKNVVQGVWRSVVVRRPVRRSSEQHREEPAVPEVAVHTFRSRGVPEVLKKLMVKLYDVFPARITRPRRCQVRRGSWKT